MRVLKRMGVVCLLFGLALWVFQASALTADPLFTLQSTLTSADNGGDDLFGSGVAFSASGEIALVSSRLAECPAGDGCGAVYVFERQGESWFEEAKLVASDGAPLDDLGSAVAISASGHVALIGARSVDCATGVNCGAAYVFVQRGETWSEVAKLTGADTDQFDNFGVSVALSANGDVALVGSVFDRCAAGEFCGSASIFRERAGIWAEEAKLAASDAAASDFFGFSVSLSGSGQTAAVGSPLDDCAGGVNCGAVYVFGYQGGSWAQERKLVSSDAAQEDQFGAPLSLSFNGNTALIAALGDDCGAGGNCGTSYIFERAGGGWSESAKLLASDGDANDLFGVGVLSASGDLALVGSRLDDCSRGIDCGSAYLFARHQGGWSEQQKITAPAPDDPDQFGFAVALSNNGIALVGARRVDCAAGNGCGAAFVFTPSH